MIRKFQKLRNANQQVFGQAFIRRLFCSLASERVSDKGREKEGKKEGERERDCGCGKCYAGCYNQSDLIRLIFAAFLVSVSLGNVYFTMPTINWRFKIVIPGNKWISGMNCWLIAAALLREIFHNFRSHSALA